VNWPARTPSIEGAPFGDVGDDAPSPQAETSEASVAQEATWQAPAQNWRLATSVFVSDSGMIPARAAKLLGQGRQYRDPV
jgi:hypothetical protein